MIKFKATLTLQVTNSKTSSMILMIPKGANAKFPSRGKSMVEGSLNGFRFPFPIALLSDGKVAVSSK